MEQGVQGFRPESDIEELDGECGAKAFLSHAYAHHSEVHFLHDMNNAKSTHELGIIYIEHGPSLTCLL